MVYGWRDTDEAPASMTTSGSGTLAMRPHHHR
jgi:hypothetical protein